MSRKPSISFEFFPPKTEEGKNKLGRVCMALADMRPAFFSVTFGAGGTTQQGSLATVLSIQQLGQPVAPHLSCVGTSCAQLKEILLSYREHGIRRLVALRGDLPSGMGQYGELRYASQLVEFIREQTGDWFHIEVAAYPEIHPQASNPQSDLENFVRKIKSGANSAITQYLFSSDAYFRFIDDTQKLGVNVPIVPGIMPITNSHQILRFSENCGADIPRWIKQRLQSYGDDMESIREFSFEVVSNLCAQLLRGGAPGLHFYTLNKSEATLKICKELISQQLNIN
ncbi:MAG: methylenetetrahydrofolate reductase [NAD(P)H] [Ottowia sp.]|nr:methylenetetrahydrofolate reductase [NAD(P)H] [Ottowia sp.]